MISRILSALASLGRRNPRADPSLLEKVAEHADTGRKLVIYERETGLYAHWYISLRCDEECYRAGRYKHALTLLLIEPSSESDPWVVQEAIADWLRWRLRKTDLAAYVGNASYVVLMPETDAEAAQILVGRIISDVEGIDVVTLSYPADGENFESLLATARRRIAAVEQAAA